MELKKNRVLPESQGNILCAEVGARVTLEDYEEVFYKNIQKIFQEHGSIRILLHYSRPFLGWDIDAAAKDLAQVSESGSKVEKAALVNPPEQVHQRWKTMQPLLSGELRIFEEGEFDKALEWIRS